MVDGGDQRQKRWPAGACKKGRPEERSARGVMGRESRLSDLVAPNTTSAHIFAAKNRAEVDAFFGAALREGGTDNGPPGERRPKYYAAFVLDPDGNNIEAVFRGE